VAIGASMVLAIATTVRPTGIVLPIFASFPVLFVKDLKRRSRITLGATAFTIPALTISGWTMRNYRSAGVSSYSFDAAIVLYYNKAAGVLGYTGISRFLPYSNNWNGT
jgi:Gpi18-like mannosyltransferase